jgi:hypothetical protein
MAGTPMSTAQYNAAREKLGMSARGAMRVFGISERQAWRLASGESAIPEPIAKLVRLALEGKVTLEDIERA